MKTRYLLDIFDIWEEVPKSVRRVQTAQNNVLACARLGWGQFLPQGHHMNKLGKFPLGNNTYQISKLNAFQF